MFSSMLMLGIKLYGDTFYTLVEANLALFIALSCGMYFWIKYIHLFFDTRINHKQSNVSKGVLLSRKEMTQQDIQIVATHEIGHAMVYAALGQLPPEFYVVIEMNQNSLGCVGGMNNYRLLNKKVFLEWIMLCNLGGRAAEEFMLGRDAVTDGATQDMLQYQQYAYSYLKMQFAGFYYTSPEREEEFQQNFQKAEKLLRKQIQQLKEFYELNRNVFDELTALLAQQKRFNREDLFPFFQRIIVPNDFPKPLGNFESFCEQWTADEEFGVTSEA